MIKFKVICPECGAWILTEAPKTLIWELCPGCKHYIMDIYDVMMAEVMPMKPSSAGIQATAH
jgi:hypothetical protein